MRVRADRDGDRLGTRETGWGERKRGRQREIGRPTETDRQVGREADRQIDGRTDRQRQKQRQKQRHETRDIQAADTNSQ